VPSNTNTPATPAPLLVDRREAGRLLGVSPGTIDNLRTRGELPSVKLLSRRLFDVADLRRYIEARKGVGQ
jgi:excisionase family DNA binding protein